MRPPTAVWLPAVLCLGLLAAPVQPQEPQRPRPSGPQMAERIRQFDADHDGRVTRAEFKGPDGIFRSVDRDGDGVIAAAELDRLEREGPPAAPQPGGAPVGSIAPAVKPLSDMAATDRYKGEDGGLYGQGRNTPPPAHLEAALAAARAIRPLGSNGSPAPDGTHPSPAGREKVARLLLDVLRTDPTAKPWFRAE